MLNASLISNKAANCALSFALKLILLQLKAEVYCKRKAVVTSSCFHWKLLHFIVKIFCRLLYIPIVLEKWRAIRASMGGVGGVLAWVACLRGYCRWRACVGGVLA